MQIKLRLLRFQRGRKLESIPRVSPVLTESLEQGHVLELAYNNTAIWWETKEWPFAPTAT